MKFLLSARMMIGWSACGYYGIDQAGCELRGCCWSPTTAAGQPWCYQVKGSYRGKTTYIIQLYKNLQDKIII